MTETPEYNLPGLINKLQEIQENPPKLLDVENKKFFIENLTKVYHGLARVLSNFSIEYLDDHDFEDELFKVEMEKRSERRNKSSLQQQTAKEKEEEKGAAGAEEGAEAKEGVEGAEGAAAEGVEGAEGAKASPSLGGNKNSKTQKRKNQSQNKTQKNR